MFGWIWHTFFYDPIYNGLVFLVSVVPGGDVGVAIILLTVAVKFLLFPLSIKAIRTQMVMRELEPKLKELQKKFKDKREELARQTIALYREAGINPFASFLLFFIQIPVIIALYLVFLRGGLPELHLEYLYSFVPTPDEVRMSLLGLVSVAEKSAVLALLAGVTQFIQAKLSLPPAPQKGKDEEPSFKDDFARTLNLQMRYVFPILITVVAYTISAAVALYFVTSNLFAIGQEIYVRKRVKNTPSTTT